jgi:hypothetical protein
MKIKKIAAAVLLTCILGLGSGFLLSGCSGVNDSLENEHIMNGGCFITCYNKTGGMSYKYGFFVKYVRVKHNPCSKNILG